jgi:hypothetical protein
MMKTVYSFFVICMTLLLVVPVQAQKDEVEFTEFTSDDESIHIAYPEDWFIYEELLLSNTVILTNNEDIFETTGSLNPDDGDLLYTMVILTEESLSILGLEIPAETVDEDLTAFALENILDPYYGLNGEQWAEDDIEIGEIMHIEVNEDFELESVILIQPNTQSVNFMYRVDEVIVLVSVSLFGGDITEIEETIYEIAASFEYHAPEQD